MSRAASKFTIRPALHTDLAAVMGIYNWAVNQTFATIDSEPLSREEAEDWWQAHGRNSRLIVAENEDGVVGWGRLLPWSRRGLSGTVEDFVYVDPLHHGNGIGKGLLRDLIDEARRLDYRTIVAQVAADNAAGVRLHEALGFRNVGTIHEAAHKFNRWVDVTIVERQLLEKKKRS
jgi:phosphinothricin acetyltransferase